MSSLSPLTLQTHQHHHSRFQIPLFRSHITIIKPPIPIFQNPQKQLSRSGVLKIRSIQQNPGESPNLANTKGEALLSTLASLYPVYVTVGGVVACLKPSTFSWFVERAPKSYSFSLGFIMLVMGLTLEFKDLVNLFMQRPLSIILGCAAQYTIMPTFGFVISKLLGLSPSLSVGLILLSCCPGGTASNVVTLIAQGDVPLSIVMTVISTLGAVFLTPLLTMVLAGTYVRVDAIKLSISTLQVVVAPVLLGSYLQSTFPWAVKAALPFAPLLAVLTASLLACSVLSENVGLLKSSMVLTPLSSDTSPLLYARAFFSSEVGIVVLAVLLLHFAGFFVGYIAATLAGFKEPQRRAVSIEVALSFLRESKNRFDVVISDVHMPDMDGFKHLEHTGLEMDLPIISRLEKNLQLMNLPGLTRENVASHLQVGMQNSSLGVVLAASHFSSAMVALPPAVSAVVMNIMGSSLGFFWKCVDPSDSKDSCSKD